MKSQIISLYLSLSILALTQNLQCDEEEIDHCIQCGTGENSDTCAQCERGYFLFFHNLLCLKCDHEFYGDVGCGGTCSSERMNETRNIVCDADSCKELYFNLKGICWPCSSTTPNCGTCTPATQTTPFTCNTCINNEWKLVDQHCEHCSKRHCVKCHYDNNWNVVCDMCKYNHFVDSHGECIKCHNHVHINGGICTVCSENLNDFSKGHCYCYYNYGKSGHSTCQYCGSHCAHCNINQKTRRPECYMCHPRYALDPSTRNCESCSANCDYCIFNKSTRKTECQRCDHRYALNRKTHECVFCEENCANCHLDGDGNPICDLCLPGFELNEDRNCLTCPEHCISCRKNRKKNDKLECTRCIQKYGVNEEKTCSLCTDPCLFCYYSDFYRDNRCKYCRLPYIVSKEDQCITCQSIAEIGGNQCYDSNCKFNIRMSRYECYLCVGHQTACDYKYYSSRSHASFCHMADPNSKNVHIDNKYKCLPNENNSGKETVNLNNCFTSSSTSK